MRAHGGRVDGLLRPGDFLFGPLAEILNVALPQQGFQWDAGHLRFLKRTQGSRRALL
jgi:hypothetical protein